MIKTAITSDAEQPKESGEDRLAKEVAGADAAEKAEEKWDARETVELASKTERNFRQEVQQHSNQVGHEQRLALEDGEWCVRRAAWNALSSGEEVVGRECNHSNPSGTPPPAWLGNREERAKCLKKLQ